MAATVVYARSRPRIAYVEEWASSTFSVAISIPQLLPAVRHRSRPPSLDRRAVTRHQMTPSDRPEPGLQISGRMVGNCWPFIVMYHSYAHLYGRVVFLGTPFPRFLVPGPLAQYLRQPASG